MKKFILVLMVLVTILTVVSCSSEKNRIIGTWENESELIGGFTAKTEYIFNEDGTGTLGSAIGVDIGFKYILNEEEKMLTITSTALGIDTTTEYSYEFAEDTLTLTSGDTVIALNRVPEAKVTTEPVTESETAA